MHQGSIDDVRLEWFLKHKVLPRCNPFPGPKSVIIMDNCSTHYSLYIKQVCWEAGVVLLYLPPYSPDFNLIEEFFSVLKAWLKRHHDLAACMPFERFLEHAVVACSKTVHAKAHFKYVGIFVDDVDEVEQELYYEDDNAGDSSDE